MTTITLSGNGYQSLGFGTEGKPLPRNVEVISVGDFSFSARCEQFREGQWHPSTFNYYHNGTRMTRMTGYSDNARYYSDTSGGDLGTLDEFASAGNLRTFGENMEARTLAQANTFIGSKDGGRVKARLQGGNDYAELHSGTNNFLNTNSGSDDIIIYGGSGKALGGSGADDIWIYGGQFSAINGNAGNDYIINYADLQTNIRGGNGDDTIVSAAGGMNAYGDSGADIFVPVSGSFMIVKDYISGVDVVNLSYLQQDYLVYQTDFGLGVGDSLGPALLLEGVTSI
jgi:Ca2+-binding RTX toxin-like protein